MSEVQGVFEQAVLIAVATLGRESSALRRAKAEIQRAWDDFVIAER